MDHLFVVFFYCCCRLKKCWEELNSILESEKELVEANEYKEARNVWVEAAKIFESEDDD